MVMTNSNCVVVCDAGPIIHLSELNQLSLLFDFPTIFVTQSVAKEVEKHRPIHLNEWPLEIVSEPVIDLQLSVLAKAYGLHTGEISALSFARTQNPVIFLTDDAAARLAAIQMSLRVHGTIGILLRAVRTRLKSVSEIKSCLESIPHSSTLHIQANLIHHAIEELEKY
jgi:predicted nucleic acid-binding protein